MRTAISRSNFKKPQSLIVMHSKSGRLTKTGRKLWNVILKISSDVMTEQENQNRPVLATVMFECPVLILAKKIEPESKEQLSLVKKHFLNLREMKLDWSSPDATTGVVFHDMNPLSEAKLEIRGGVLWAMWSFPPSIMRTLMDSSAKYTWVDIQDLVKLDTYAAMALFEICLKYKNNPTKLTSRKPVDWWMDALSGWRYKDNPDEVEKKREWRKFKNQYVNGAIEEINQKTNLFITIIEEKVGRTIVNVQFKVEVTKQAQDDVDGIPFELAKKGEQLNISFVVIDQVLKSGVSSEKVGLSMDKMQKRVENESLEPVINNNAYFKSLVNDVDKSVADKAEVTTSADEIKIVPEDSDVTDSQLVIERIKYEISQLTDEELSAYQDSAVSIIKARGLYSGKTRERVEKGLWGSGIAQTVLHDAYGSAVYGPDWRACTVQSLRVLDS